MLVAIGVFAWNVVRVGGGEKRTGALGYDERKKAHSERMKHDL